jgi:hypothetical protein
LNQVLYETLGIVDKTSLLSMDKKSPNNNNNNNTDDQNDDTNKVSFVEINNKGYFFLVINIVTTSTILSKILSMRYFI